MNGLILINKPVGMTSADVVYKLRKILHLKKNRSRWHARSSGQRRFANCGWPGDEVN